MGVLYEYCTNPLAFHTHTNTTPTRNYTQDSTFNRVVSAETAHGRKPTIRETQTRHFFSVGRIPTRLMSPTLHKMCKPILPQQFQTKDSSLEKCAPPTTNPFSTILKFVSVGTENAAVHDSATCDKPHSKDLSIGKAVTILGSTNQ